MKIKIIILITLCYTIYGFGQIKQSDIIGKWIKYKNEMKDGSKILPRPYTDSTYYEFVINNSKIYMNSDPIHKINNVGTDNLFKGSPIKPIYLGINYTLEGTLLKTSATSGYLIEKITSDTLIVCQKTDGLEDDKLRRYYLINEKKLIQKEYEKRKGKRNIIATRFFTPKLNKSIESEIFQAIQNNNLNLDLAGALTIFPSKSLITSEISYSSKNNPTKVQIIEDIINNSFKKWDLDNFKEFESIKIPFILRSELTDSYRGVKIIYFTNNISDFNIHYGGVLQLKGKDQELFQKGIEAYNKKKFLKAAEYFSKSYESNSNNTDALYNQAASYFENGDKENACKIWKQLFDLEQTNGIALYKSNCN